MVPIELAQLESLWPNLLRSSLPPDCSGNHLTEWTSEHLPLACSKIPLECIFRTVPDHDGGQPMEVNACILTTHMVYLKPKQSLGYQQHSFRLLLLYMHNWYHSSISGILYVHGHKLQFTIIHGAFPLLLLPLASSPFSPFVPPFTYLEPS
jgi:hypothetical protein